MKLHLVSLGCARNSIDSEIILGRLEKAGWSIEDEPDQADVIIINTCSFIESAVNESVDTILELAKFKKKGACKNLIVAGCLPERFREKIIETLPEVDYFIGTGAFDEIVQVVEKSSGILKYHLPDPANAQFRGDKRHIRPISSHSVYIKIAEGCNRRCTYCIIPKLRGKQRSRTVNDIVEEASSLVASGVRELILVAQDTTSYGKDLHPQENIGNLLEEITKISDEIWIRILYGHPESIDESFIKLVGSYNNICSYFDIPIQHVSTPVLKKMGRIYSKKSLYSLFEKIRSTVADAVLRTTLIIGFPGEKEEEFIELYDFIEDIQFDHLGVFIYSDFEDLPSHRMPEHVPKEIAEKRYHRLMSRQMEISLKKNQEMIGKNVYVLVEEKIEPGVFVGRTRYQSPDVDGIIYVHTEGLQPGSFVNVKISDALEYDLTGEAV